MSLGQRLRLQSVTAHDRKGILLPSSNGVNAHDADSVRRGGMGKHMAGLLSPSKTKSSRILAASAMPPPLNLKYGPIEHVIQNSYEYSPTSSSYSDSADEKPIKLGAADPSASPVRRIRLPSARKTRSSTEQQQVGHPSIPPQAQTRQPDPSGVFPQEVFNLIVSYVPRRSIPSLAVVSSKFRTAARATLYATVDVRFIRSSRFEELCTVLATHPDLAALVETFSYHTWHPVFFARSRDAPLRSRETQVTLLSPTAAAFIRALENMRRLRYITLPSFNAGVMQSVSSSELKGVTFLNRSFPAEDLHELRLWLFTQPNLRNLSLPSLLEKSGSDTPSNSSESTPLITSNLPETPNSRTLHIPPPVPEKQSPLSLHPPISPTAAEDAQRMPSSPVSSTTTSFSSLQLLPNEPFLPALKTLLAPPSVAQFILSAPSRQSMLLTPPDSTLSLPIGGALKPLEQIIIPVHTTIYSGLRPIALMQALGTRGTKRLTLRFGDATDRRTLEKVVSAVGSVLGQASGRKRGGHDVAALRSLDIEIVKSGQVDADILYKIISTSISRFRALSTLRLRYAKQVRLFASSTATARHSAESLPLSTRPLPSVPSTVGTRSGFGIDDAGFPSRSLTDADLPHITLWLKQCTTLTTVSLLSGAEWRSNSRRRLP